MNHYGIQRNGVVVTPEEMRMKQCGGGVVCPKPRRLGFVHSTSAAAKDVVRPRSRRNYHNYQAELFPDSNAGSEILDIILSKGGGQGPHGVGISSKGVASSPPFFSGSPPSRVSNPLIQDARFQDVASPVHVSLLHPVIQAPSGSASSPTTSSSRKGGCVRANFGTKPAVRIEGFDCLDRDSRNCSIPALA